MSNIKKSFNFRYGVQVDEDNFIVNSNGLVGIGTSVPTEFLDVRGTAKVVGLVTSNSLHSQHGFVGVLTVTNLTAGGLSANAGIITATSPYPLGIVTYFGDGGNLLNLPTSQWIDVDTGFGYTSIYAAGNVGVGTTYPDYTFQVGGTPGYKAGVGVNSTGDIYLTGIITAGSHGIFGGNIIGAGIGSFAGNLITNRILTVGSGATIAGGIVVGGGATINGNLNFGGSASFNTSGSFGGTLTVGGGITASSFGFFGSNLVVGGGATIAGDLYVNQSIISTLDFNAGRYFTAGSDAAIGGGLIVGAAATVNNNLTVNGNGSFSGNLTAGKGSVTGDLVIGAGGTFGKNLVVGGGSTISGGLVVGGGLTVTNSQNIGKTLIVGETANVGSTLYVAGVTTIGARLNANTSAIIGNVEINVIPNTIFVSSGNLLVNTSGGIVTVQDNVTVSNQLSVVQLFTADGGSNLSDVRVGIDTRNKIDTSVSDLILGAFNDNVRVEDNLNVVGTISAGAGATITGSIFASNNMLVVGVATFGGNINSPGLVADDVRIGVVAANTIDSTSAELRLDSSQDKVRILGDLEVDRNSYLTGITTVSDLQPTSNLTGNLGSSSKRFGEAYIDDIRIGVTGSSIIDTVSGNLELSSAGGTIQLNNNTEIIANSLEIGNPTSLYLDGSNKSIGIGTTNSNYSLNILTSGNSGLKVTKENVSSFVEVSYNPSTSYPFISIGSGSIGSGSDNVSLTFDDQSFTLSNEDYGDMIFILDNSTTNIGSANTGSFILKHGRTSTDLLTVNHRGQVAISSDVNIANNKITFSSTGNVAISSNFSAGNGALRVDNLSGVSTITKLNVTTEFNIPQTAFIRQSNGRTTLNRLEVYNTVGVGTNTVSCVVDFSKAGISTVDYDGLNLNNTNKRFMLPPIVTGTERTGLATVAGAIIYNSDTNKHQGWNGTAWFDFY